jgi:hypothetical protein
MSGKALFLILNREEKKIFYLFKIFVFILVEKIIITEKRATLLVTRGNYTSFINKF